MGKTIWKYEVANDITMPIGATFLHGDIQHGKLCMWFLVNKHGNAQESRGFTVVGTGQSVPDHATYLFTYIEMGGALVFHVFEINAQKDWL